MEQAEKMYPKLVYQMHGDHMCLLCKVWNEKQLQEVREHANKNNILIDVYES